MQKAPKRALNFFPSIWAVSYKKVLFLLFEHFENDLTKSILLLAFGFLISLSVTAIYQFCLMCISKFSSFREQIFQEEPSPVPAGVAAPAAAENKIAHELAKNQKKDSGDETLDAKMKRAQRFGLPLSDEQLKLKRAER